MKKNSTYSRFASKVPAYKNSSLSAAARVKDLMARMSLDEKVAQMMCVWKEKATKLVDTQDNFVQSYL